MEFDEGTDLRRFNSVLEALRTELCRSHCLLMAVRWSKDFVDLRNGTLFNFVSRVEGDASL